MRLIILSILFILTFTACSTTTMNQQDAKVNNSAQVESSDDFSDEFEDESIEESDPLEGYNRAMTTFNDAFYVHVVDPVAQGYAYVLPQTARKGISNVFDNLMFPIRFVNNVLQLKFQNAGEELGRFVLNSTFGLAGLINVADMHTPWEEHDEDFGQTLGFYGVGSGYHVVLPFLGPSNVRDIVGFSVDAYADPTFSLKDKSYKIPDNLEKSIGLYALRYLNETSLRPGEYESLKKDAIDLYPFLRDVYEQKRDNDIKE